MKKLDTKTIKEIYELTKQNYPVEEILRILNIRKSTYYNYLERGENQAQTKLGRKNKLTPEIISKVISFFRKGTLINAIDGVGYIQSTYNITISDQTMRNILKENGFKCY
ncbi:hypothetical protein BB558_001673 [Smittium angustum]|uniref:Resolvase HTH domain-containing protein n=1 Tax=Smittium angustum TaxID=133377 RepID=A0A2U1JAP4_SMIAN|nr:hypothetical protein BB558_001673 [Smittium angustum]